MIKTHNWIFDEKTCQFRPITKHEEQELRRTYLAKQAQIIDVFRGDYREKLWRIADLKDPDGYLGIALSAIRYFFYGNRDDDNPFVKDNLYRLRYVETFNDEHNIHYEVGCWLFDSEAWAKLLKTEPLHVVFDEFIRPLRDRIAELFQEIEERKEKVAAEYNDEYWEEVG